MILNEHEKQIWRATFAAKYAASLDYRVAIHYAATAITDLRGCSRPESDEEIRTIAKAAALEKPAKTSFRKRTDDDRFTELCSVARELGVTEVRFNPKRDIVLTHPLEIGGPQDLIIYGASIRFEGISVEKGFSQVTPELWVECCTDCAGDFEMGGIGGYVKCAVCGVPGKTGARVSPGSIEKIKEQRRRGADR